MDSNRYTLMIAFMAAAGCVNAPIDEKNAVCSSGGGETNAIAKMRALEGGLNIDAPGKDAYRNFRNEDFRFLMVMSGLGVDVPGVESSDHSYVCKFGVRFVEGTAGDSFDKSEGEKYMRLDKAAKLYAQDYNAKMLLLLKNDE